MKKANLFFVIAAIFLVGAAIFAISLMINPGKDAQIENAPEEKVETELSEEELLVREAEMEIERFKNEYGMEISLDEMIKQIQIRKDYEAEYKNSYPLEEVFLAEVPVDETVGDPGYVEDDLTTARIAAYKRLYNFDESRYASMTVDEQLVALQIEYGPLSEEEEQKIIEHMEGNAQSVTDYFKELKEEEERNAQNGSSENGSSVVNAPNSEEQINVNTAETNNEAVVGTN